MIVKTEAIVLKSLKYGDTSKIVTLYTKSFGRISVMAKGARGKRNTFASSLEPMSYIQCVFYRKEQRDLQILSAADHIETFPALSRNERKLAAGLCIIETLNACLHDEENHPELFTLVLDALRSTNDAERNELNPLLWFLLRLGDLLGFRLQVETCVNCGTPVRVDDAATSGVRLLVECGGVVCAACNPGDAGNQWGVATFRAFLWLIRASAGQVTVLHLEDGTAMNLVHLTTSYLRNHVPGMRRIHSMGMLEMIVRGTSTA